jgi:hypothetical protein
MTISMEFDIESLVRAPFINDEGKSERTKGPIIEQAVFDQEELEALVEVAKQKTSPRGNNRGL